MLAVATCRDTLHVGLHADPAAIPGLDELADALSGALTELVQTAAS